MVVRPLTELAADLIANSDFGEAEGLLGEAWNMEQSFNYFRVVQQRQLHENYVKLYTEWAKTDPTKAPLGAEWQRKLDALPDSAATRKSAVQNSD